MNYTPTIIIIDDIAEASSYKASDDEDSFGESSEDTSNVNITLSKYTADFAGIKWFTFARLSQRFSDRLRFSLLSIGINATYLQMM